MDIHKNARLTFVRREQLIRRVIFVHVPQPSGSTVTVRKDWWACKTDLRDRTTRLAGRLPRSFSAWNSFAVSA